MPDDAGTARPTLELDAALPEIALIADAGLRDKVRAVWQALWARSDFTDFATVPTSGEIAYPNLPHMRCVIALTLAIAEKFETFHGVTVNRDVLLAACLLQDASKIVEYRPKPGGGVEKTPIGKAVPHAFEAARIALEHRLPLEVVHIIATHSPQAARFPDTLEGKIIYYADQLDVIAIHGDRWVKEQVIRR